MLARLITGSLLATVLMASPCYAEMNVGTNDSNSGKLGVSASANIRITVHIPVRATLQLSAEQGVIQTKTNLRNQQAMILSCQNSQGSVLADCKQGQNAQVYTLTTL